MLKLKKLHCFRDILSICQLHILLSRTAQISLELHFCVELHTKKSPGLWAITQLRFHDPQLRRFDTIQQCDRRTDRQKDASAVAKTRAVALHVHAVARKMHYLQAI